MNIIINGFHDPRQASIITDLILHFKCEKACVVLAQPTLQQSSTVKILLVKDIIAGDYGSFSERPLSTELLDYIQPLFPNLLNMTTRFEVYQKRHLAFEERKRILYGHLSFWYNYFQEVDVGFYISANIPHDIYDYAILVIADFFKKTKKLYFYQSNFRDIVIPMADFEEQNPCLRDLYHSTTTESVSGEVKLHELAEIEWDLETRSEVPFYMRPQRRRVSTYLKKVNALGPDAALKMLYWFRCKQLRRNYSRVSSPPDLSKKYIYMPLHYQPELTTCPLGGPLNDQYLIIRLIDSLLPDDMYLYVKEHPKQLFAHRYLDYYHDILRETKRTSFVSASCPSPRLIEHSAAVATVTGTAGWEALFKKKPVLLFGYIFYQFAPGVFHITDTQKCAESIAAIARDGFHYDERRLKLFLNCVVDTSIHGFSDELYAAQSKFTFAESNRNMIEYMKRAALV